MFRDGNCLSPLTREPLQPTLFFNWNLKRRMQEHDEDILRAAATAVANASDGAQQQGPAAGGGEPSTEPAPKRRRRTPLIIEELSEAEVLAHSNTHLGPRTPKPLELEIASYLRSFEIQRTHQPSALPWQARRRSDGLIK